MSAQTTIRTCVANLQEAGALIKHEIGGSPYAVENELTAGGQEILLVAGIVDTWLALAPEGPIAPDSNASKAAVKALVGGWGSTVMQTLAAEPRSLTQLDGVIPSLGYPVLKRRLTGMRLSQQIELVVGTSAGIRPYAVTDWLRRSMAPICAAGRCERRHMGETTIAMTDAEVETAFLLAVPLAVLPITAYGTCTMGIEARADLPAVALAKPAGATIGVNGGEIVSCVGKVDEGWSSWALGTAQTWLDVFIDGNLDARLRLADFEPPLATQVVHGVHAALFGD